MHTGVKVVTSAVKSDHLAIIAYTGSQPIDISKKRTVLQYRPRSPDQHAAFLSYLYNKNWNDVINATETQSAFDIFYAKVLSMLDIFYPLLAVTVTIRDPYIRYCHNKVIAEKAQSAYEQGENRKGWFYN